MSDERPVSSPANQAEAGHTPDPSPPRPGAYYDGAPAADYGGDLETGEGFQPAHYLRVLYKRRWIAITVFLLVSIVSAVRAYTLVPIYEARARLLMEQDSLNVVSFEAILKPDAGSNYQTQYMILQSRSLARKTLESLDMLPRSAEGKDAEGGTVAEAERPAPAPEPAAKSGGWFGLRRQLDSAVAFVKGWLPASPDQRASGPAATASETDAEARAVDAFLGGLVVTPIPNSQLVDVRYRSTDPEVAAKFANALARQHIEQNLEFKFLASKEATDWLAARLTEQRQKVEASEQALLTYQERYGVVSPEGREDVIVQKLTDLTTAVTAAKKARIENEVLFNQARAIQKDQASLDAFPPVLSNAFVQQLKIELATLQRQHTQLSQTLGERHPDIVAVRTAIHNTETRLQNEIGRIIDSVEAEYIAARAAEASLVDAFEVQKREALALNRRGVERAILQREAESNRQIYESLMRRAKETNITNELKTNNIRILDAAEVPRAAVWPDRSGQIRLAVLWALALALGIAFGLEYLDNRIKSPDDVKGYLRLPFLGLVPTAHPPVAPGSNIEVPSLFMNNGSSPIVAEAFRSVRTNVLFSALDQQPQKLVVTSANPDEGKTVIATNLAVAIAQAGQRALLIDADLRQPRVHEVFGQKARPGLTDLIVGTSKASEAVRTSRVPGLWILPAGQVPPNPAELLGSRRFAEFLKQLDEHFDWVILDSPPVMAVTDPTVVAHVVSSVLFVVGADMTSRVAAREATQRLAAVGARCVGVVLNRVDIDRNPYYYPPYYRRKSTRRTTASRRDRDGSRS